VSPLMPEGWDWVALRDVPYHGQSFSYFIVRESEGGSCVYATLAIDSDWPTKVYATDVSDDVWIYSKDAIAVALRRDEDLVVLIGNAGSETIYAPVQFADAELLPERAEVRVYNSERRSWEARGTLERNQLSSIAFSIEHGGFRLLEVTRKG
jgi:hypothetical protein